MGAGQPTDPVEGGTIMKPRIRANSSQPRSGARWARLLRVLVVGLLGCAAAGVGFDLGAQSTEPPTDASFEYPTWETLEPGEHAAYNQRLSLVQRGREVYDGYCVGCHGEYGDGKGAAAARLLTQPRDFTKGIYKFRSTDSSSLPLDADLHRVITLGLERVSMPAFPLMPEGDKVAVIQYIKTFYPHWHQRSGRRTIVPVPQEPSDLSDSMRLARGRIVYMATQCWKCHGSDGRGTGATQTDYTDAWGNQQAPFDFTRGGLKGGQGAADIYRTFHAGLRSVMPSFGGDTMGRVTADAFRSSSHLLEQGEMEDLLAALIQFPGSSGEVAELTPTRRQELAERNSWDLVTYILSLRTETSTALAVLGPGGANPTEQVD